MQASLGKAYPVWIASVWLGLGHCRRGALVFTVLLSLVGTISACAVGSFGVAAAVVLSGGCLSLMLVDFSRSRTHVDDRQAKSDVMEQAPVAGGLTSAGGLDWSRRDPTDEGAFERVFRELAQVSEELASVNIQLTTLGENLSKSGSTRQSDQTTQLGEIGDQLDVLSVSFAEFLANVDDRQRCLKFEDEEQAGSRALRMLRSTAPNSLQRRVALDGMAVASLYSEDPCLKALPLCVGWALDPVALWGVLQEVSGIRCAGTILEVGSGVSTSWIAYALSKREVRPTFVSIEHDPIFYASTAGQLKRAGLSEFVDLRLAPFESYEVSGKSFTWYSNWGDLGKVSLVLVDGPPGKTGKNARFPALPLLASKLAQGAVVLLDDTDRKDEAEIAERWSGERYSGVTVRRVRSYGRVMVFEASVESATS